MYRVAYGTSAGSKTFREFDPNPFSTVEAAIKQMRSYKRRGYWAWIEDDRGNFVPVPGAKSERARKAYPVRSHSTVAKSAGQLNREIDASLKSSKSSKSKAPPRIAYRLQLTPSELRAVEFARGRYSWPDMLAAHASESGAIAFTEPEMWSWCDDVDSDAEGGHSPFPLASGAFADKLQRFYDERV